MATTNYSFNLPTVGGSEDAWGTQLNANWTALDTLLGGVTATEFDILDGATVTTAELNILYGVTATTAEINVLYGVTATTVEVNYLSGVTSAIQTQIDGTVKTTGDQSIAGTKTFTGAVAVAESVTSTADNDGTLSTGSYTPTPVGGNFKRILNAGAFTLAAPTAAGDYTLVIQITNASGAGAIANSGFNRVSGDAFTTTVGHDFFVFITKCNGFTSANVQALQ